MELDPVGVVFISVFILLFITIKTSIYTKIRDKENEYKREVELREEEERKNKEEERKIKEEEDAHKEIMDSYVKKIDDIIDVAYRYVDSCYVDLDDFIGTLNGVKSAMNISCRYDVSYDVCDRLLFEYNCTLKIMMWMQDKGYNKVLSKKKNNLCFLDDYGDLDKTKFELEYADFIKKRFGDIFDMFKSSLMCDVKFTDEELKSIINDVIEYYKDNVVVFSQKNNIIDIKDPYKYEASIANIISSVPGFSARTTSGSGDQGADVIAYIGEFSIVVQCKLYSSPVGNKAVQEVSAAKGFYNAHHAIVVTNNEFTKSAKILANSLDVDLLHHSDVEKYFSSWAHAYQKNSPN